jgi:hypothetical protein
MAAAGLHKDSLNERAFMSTANWFWIIYVIALLFTGFISWPFTRISGVSLVLFILLGILGYAVFGSVVHN